MFNIPDIYYKRFHYKLQCYLQRLNNGLKFFLVATVSIIISLLWCRHLLFDFFSCSLSIILFLFSMTFIPSLLDSHNYWREVVEYTLFSLSSNNSSRFLCHCHHVDICISIFTRDACMLISELPLTRRGIASSCDLLLNLCNNDRCLLILFLFFTIIYSSISLSSQQCRDEERPRMYIYLCTFYETFFYTFWLFSSTHTSLFVFFFLCFFLSSLNSTDLAVYKLRNKRTEKSVAYVLSSNRMLYRTRCHNGLILN
jgi:hypothetical protein